MMTTRDRKPKDKVYAVYARAATGGPAAVEKQVHGAREAVRRRGGDDGRGLAIQEYRDVNVAGTDEPGPALAAMLDDAAAGKIDVVMVRDVARLTRSPGRLAAIAAAIERAGARIVVFQGGHGNAAADLAALADTLTPGRS